jgi:epoxyqueuosine reductase
VARARPAQLIAGTLRVISCRMNYRSGTFDEQAALSDPGRAYVASYARGRDYHSLMRSRLQKLCDRIEADAGPFGHRVFCDSAPVLEVGSQRSEDRLARQNALLLARDAGPYFFRRSTRRCRCPDRSREASTAGLAARASMCPTQAIRAPCDSTQRRCISVPDHRAQRRGSGGIAAADRKPRLRLRRLPACIARGIRSRAVGEFRLQLPPRLDRSTLVGSCLEQAGLRRADAAARDRRIGYERWLRNLAIGALAMPVVAGGRRSTALAPPRTRRRSCEGACRVGTLRVRGDLR